MEKKSKPNILMFLPHDLGDHLCCYGHTKVQSPNLDEIANEGVIFSNCFATAPECTPSRSGIFTGLYTHQNGLMGLCHRGWEFNHDAKHLVQYLWESGYETYLFGLQHETCRDTARLGYNRSFSQQNLSCEGVCDELVEFIKRYVINEAKPWFVFAGFSQVHRPWREDTSFSPNDIEVPPYLPDNIEVRKDFTEFYQAIADMDAAVGRVIDALDEAELNRNTIVIFTTDHGIPFPRAKSTFYDSGIKVPLIIRWPEHFKRGAVYDQLISNMDICPTILELAGIEIPKGLEGRSFMPLLYGRSYKDREAVFGAFYYDSFYDPMHYVRTSRYKYIRSFAITPEDTAGAYHDVLAKHETGIWIRADDSDVQRSRTWKSMKGPFFPPPPEELYDLKIDPLEQNNLVGNPKYEKILNEFREQMFEMMKRTNSPLLKCHVSPALSITGNKKFK